LINEPAVNYLNEVVRIHSSNVIHGSIWHTTYTRTIKLIRDWIQEKYTYTEIAKKITELDPLVFSKNRAENIAITELRNAYEYGRYRNHNTHIDNAVSINGDWWWVDDNDIIEVGGTWYEKIDGDVVEIDGTWYRTDDDDIAYCECDYEYHLTDDLVYHDSRGWILLENAVKVKDVIYHKDEVEELV
jgi:hypothetical protein